MQVCLMLAVLVAAAFGLRHCLMTSIKEHEQAALLPFADDPEAARRVARETGAVCQRVVRPLEEPRPAPGLSHFRA